MAFLAARGRISTDARTRICREVRHLLGRLRALGVTRPGGSAAGLGEDFTLTAGDIPIKPEDPEPNRDLPAEVMRQLCEHLPALEHAISCREVRVAVELIIDTGRRPDEICRPGTGTAWNTTRTTHRSSSTTTTRTPAWAGGSRSAQEHRQS